MAATSGKNKCTTHELSAEGICNRVFLKLQAHYQGWWADAGAGKSSALRSRPKGMPTLVLLGHSGTRHYNGGTSGIDGRNRHHYRLPRKFLHEMKTTFTNILIAAAMTSLATASTCFVYVGSYTKGPQEGISCLKFDESTGALENLGFVAAAPNPTFLALDSKGEFLYAIHEREPGTVAAYKIDRASGKLTFINSQQTKGNGPCHLTVDKARANLLVANYASGSVCCLPITAEGGLSAASSSIQHTGKGPNASRQEGPHAHGVYLSPDEKFALVADLGTDKINIYKFDGSKGLLTPNEPAFGQTAPGAGPRHGTFSPDGSKFYIINELDNTITSFTWDASKGTLTPISSQSTLPEPVKDSTTAEIEFHPNGKVLYGSNRGHNSIARFSVDASGGFKLLDTTTTGGPAPRHFAVHPNGKWMLAGTQTAETLVTYAVDPESGKLTQHGDAMKLRSPVCLVFLRIP
jgi:6-phosphogluconolactonase